MKRAHAIAMFERLASESRGTPKHGYNRRAVFMSASHACDAGSEDIVCYELGPRDLASIVRMLKAGRVGS